MRKTNVFWMVSKIVCQCSQSLTIPQLPSLTIPHHPSPSLIPQFSGFLVFKLVFLPYSHTIASKCNSRTRPNIPFPVQNTLVPVQIVQKTVQIQMTFLGISTIYPPSKFNHRYLKINVQEFFQYLYYILSYFGKTEILFPNLDRNMSIW